MEARHGFLAPPDNGIHVSYAFSYADAAARIAATGFVATDVGKDARQLDDNSRWTLTAITPTWVFIGGGASGLSSLTSAQLATALSDETGTGLAVFATNPVLTTPNIGTPSAATLTNATGLPIATGVSGLGALVAAFLATPSSANLAAAVTDETGTGAAVFGTSPVFTTQISTPAIVSPAALTVTPAAGSGVNVALSTTGDFAINTNQFYVDTSAGNVGIGTTGPTQKLEVVGSISSLPATSGTAQTGTARFHPGFGTTTTLDIGTYNSTGVSWIQATDISNLATNYSLLLNPNGGNVGIGTTAPATPLHGVSTTATTNARRDILTLGANVTDAGVGAAGLGVGVLLQAESSTTVDTTQALIATEWLVATHATRTARLSLSAYDTAVREGIRIDADGTEARLGFYGVTASARQLLATGAGATVDQVISALQTLGLLRQV